jgi:hypothetical protein
MAKKTTKQTKQTRNTQKRAQPKNNLLLWGGGALLVVVLVVSAILLGNRQDSPARSPAEEISVDQAYQKYQAGAFVLDVRTGEWDAYHAPGTTLIPHRLGARLAEVPQDKEIVVVCRSGNPAARTGEISC